MKFLKADKNKIKRPHSDIKRESNISAIPFFSDLVEGLEKNAHIS